MIDIENELFTMIAKALRTEYDDIFVTGEYVKTPPKFPCVSIVEIDNSEFDRTKSSSPEETHSVIVYEVNVYSNKQSGKKTECKSIIADIDTILQRLNFTRIMCEPVPNLDESTIYRMLGRYRAVVSANKTLYRR